MVAWRKIVATWVAAILGDSTKAQGNVAASAAELQKRSAFLRWTIVFCSRSGRRLEERQVTAAATDGTSKAALGADDGGKPGGRSAEERERRFKTASPGGSETAQRKRGRMGDVVPPARKRFAGDFDEGEARLHEVDPQTRRPGR